VRPPIGAIVLAALVLVFVAALTLVAVLSANVHCGAGEVVNKGYGCSKHLPP
jgi:hypothetical protein